MGMNRKVSDAQLCSGTYRENTVTSFRNAAANGAAFIEFDVQVAKDGVPVIWHDDFAVVKAASGRYERSQIKDMSVLDFQALPQQAMVRECEDAAEPLDWSCSIENALPTLSQVFKAMPESIGFDIELKMTTPADEPCTPPDEVERTVAAVLAEVSRWERSSYRRMIFSTFDPDVAIALKSRQKSIPVLFLSNGKTHYADERRCGFAAAVAFARRSGLDGVVLEISRLRQQPRLAADARALGLFVLTYGRQNDDPVLVREQAGWGVQASIVDDVRGVVDGLSAQQGNNINVPVAALACCKN